MLLLKKSKKKEKAKKRARIREKDASALYEMFPDFLLERLEDALEHGRVENGGMMPPSLFDEMLHVS